MRKSQDAWPEVAEALTEAVRTCGLDDASLARASGANYYAVRRIRLDGVTNRSRNATALCTFFRLAPRDCEPVTDSSTAWLEVRIGEVWDGTPEHRQFLQELLGWASRYKVTPRELRRRHAGGQQWKAPPTSNAG